MSERDAGWAVRQYEAVRALLPASNMPKQSETAANLGAITRHIDVFLLDAFGVLNVGDTAIAGAPERVRQLQQMGKRVIVLTNSATFPAEQTLHTDVPGGAAYGVQTVLVTEHGLLSGRDRMAFITQTGIVPNYSIPNI